MIAWLMQKAAAKMRREADAIDREHRGPYYPGSYGESWHRFANNLRALADALKRKPRRRPFEAQAEAIAARYPFPPTTIELALECGLEECEIEDRLTHGLQMNLGEQPLLDAVRVRTQEKQR